MTAAQISLAPLLSDQRFRAFHAARPVHAPARPGDAANTSSQHPLQLLNPLQDLLRRSVFHLRCNQGDLKQKSRLSVRSGSMAGFSAGDEIGAAGFEPTTPTTPKWCATKLRYAPVPR